MKRRRSLYARPRQSSEESNAPGVRCWRQRRRGGRGGVVADIAKLSVGREEYYTRELATDHQAYLSGHSVIRPGFRGGSIAWKAGWSHGTQQQFPPVPEALPARAA